MANTVIRVAVDGSVGSRRALRWALDEANLRRSGVAIVSVYAATPPIDIEIRRVAAEVAIRATVRDIAAGGTEVPPMSWETIAGEPADVLTNESSRSALPVMGSHGVAELRRSGRGSVAEMCSRTSACPVVIIPAADSSTDADHLTNLAVSGGRGRP